MIPRPILWSRRPRRARRVRLRSLTLALVLTLALLLFLAGAFWWPSAPAPVSPHGLRVLVDGELRAVLATRAVTVGEALAQAGLALGPWDQVTPSPQQPLSPGAATTVRIRKARALVVEADGRRFSGLSAAPGVSTALAEMGLRIGAHDHLQVRRLPHGPGGEALEVKVVRVRHQVVMETVPIPFSTVRRPDESLPVGQMQEMEAGRPGLLERRVRRTYENGVLTAEEVLAERRVQEPEPRVVAVGTAGRIARGGEMYRYRRVLAMRATAYSPGDGYTPGIYTATGIRAQYGVAAVDPEVIPLGTHLYVEGYGPALAADTGGAIQGHRIDLAFDTPAEARAFGVQDVTVYVLEGP